MVKFFTQNESLAYSGEKEHRPLSSDQFEQALHANIKRLSKDPSQRTIDSILEYSKNHRKQN